MNNHIESKLLKEMKDLAPDFVKYGENILFGEVWNDPTLTSKERSLSTLSALISIGNTEQMPFHLQLAKKNGVTEKEMIALITHMAFYVEWPKASAAMNIVARQ
ncbi:carboxymuconolactone decarboxylase family protein [Priestia aryabhattai]|uniref:carboxymuconolactone decarboxylase family protein n=1 Tax=Priestia aryabhattai TaxID=412384 RepID=UPI00203FEAB1|nr:carboxymuconolactone decarboxylase family protein [Priestia aryabhattai]MCM3768928.1 carboxymuconolactone decarboxylase family protein [Priestia aryabhattai]